MKTSRILFYVLLTLSIRIGYSQAASEVEVFPLQENIPISDLVYGTNNYWTEIPINDFSTFFTKLTEIGQTMMRYPGGWESEHYTWHNPNDPLDPPFDTPGWKKTTR